MGFLFFWRQVFKDYIFGNSPLGWANFKQKNNPKESPIYHEFSKNMFWDSTGCFLIFEVSKQNCLFCCCFVQLVTLQFVYQHWFYHTVTSSFANISIN